MKVQTRFVDVGQGTCNIILIGDKRAIIIDAGPPDNKALLQFLKRYVMRIEALIISHNHADHDGGVARILENYPKAIKRIYFLQDSPPETIRTYLLAKREAEAGRLLKHPERLEAGDRPMIIFPRAEDAQPGDATRFADISLKLLFPAMMDNLSAQRGAGDKNATSAILAFFCGRRSVLFPGDASEAAWKSLHDRLGTPIACDIMVAPHHGGKLFDCQPASFYGTLVAPKVVIFSTGTANAYGHPDADMVRNATASGAKVICTQITSQCHPDLEQLRPGVLTPVFPSLSTPLLQLNNRGRSLNVACASTVIATISSDAVTIAGIDSHQAAVDRLPARGGHPLCRG